jgi:hypothetical protein
MLKFLQDDGKTSVDEERAEVQHKGDLPKSIGKLIARVRASRPDDPLFPFLIRVELDE